MNFNTNKSLFVSAKSNDVSGMQNTENCLAIILAGGSGLPSSGLIPAESSQAASGAFFQNGGQRNRDK